MAPKITLHFIPIPGSRADRLFWILEELGLEYNVQAHLQQGPTSPSFKEVSVLGKVGREDGARRERTVTQTLTCQDTRSRGRRPHLD